MCGQSRRNDSRRRKGKCDAEGCCGRGDASTHERHAKFLERAIDAFASGFFGYAEDGTDLDEAALFEKAQDDRFAFVVFQRDDGVVEHGPKLLRIGIRNLGRIVDVHGLGRRFPMLAPLLAANEIGRCELGRDVKPASERGVVKEVGRFSCKGGEDSLRDVFGEMRIAADATQRAGIDERDVEPHEFGKSGFRTLFDVIAEK